MCSDSNHSMSNRNRCETANNSSENEHDSGVSVSGPLSHSSSPSRSEADLTDVIDIELPNSARQQEALKMKELDDIKKRSENLAKYAISQSLGPSVNPANNVEATLLRCIESMTTKHEILFNGMLKKLKINEDTAYTAFIAVADELFEGEKVVINWGRIVALYAFGCQLALYCKEKKFIACGERIPTYLGTYAKDTLTHFIHKEGGWDKLCVEFRPKDDLDNKVWKVLAWTAVGLGLASAASFLSTH